MVARDAAASAPSKLFLFAKQESEINQRLLRRKTLLRLRWVKDLGWNGRGGRSVWTDAFSVWRMAA